MYKLLTGPIVTVCCIRSRYSSQEVNVTTSLPPRPPPALSDLSIAMIYQSCISHRGRQIPYGLVVRIRRSHRRGPGSIPGVGRTVCFFFFFFDFVGLLLLRFPFIHIASWKPLNHITNTYCLSKVISLKNSKLYLHTIRNEANQNNFSGKIICDERIYNFIVG